MSNPPEDIPPARPVLSALAKYGYLFVLGLALAELIAHFVSLSRVPTDADWAEAASFVRGELEEDDVIVAAPDFIDPIVRRELGDTMSLAEAGYSDIGGFDRVWALAIRGHRPSSVGDQRVALERSFGAVRVLRWDRGPSQVRYDFSDHIAEAVVELDGARCPFGLAAPFGGGLGQGSMPPLRRFTCGDPGRWVGETVVEDLALRPRRCIRLPPTPGQSLRVTMREVPRGDHLVVFAGLYAEDERMEEGAPITLEIARNGRPFGALHHADGEGWKRERFAIPDGSPTLRDSYTFEAVTTETHRRSLCFAASVRDGKDVPQ